MTKSDGVGEEQFDGQGGDAKHTSVTASALRRPCQLSSVSARALAMIPRNNGISRPISS